MPETPDFEQLARQLTEKLSPMMDARLARAIALDTLRLVWNARGAADRKAIAASDDQDILDCVLERLDR